MSTPTTQTTDGAAEAELAGAPLDLLLTDAARGNWRRLLPGTNGAVALVRGLANRPAKVACRARGLVGELGRIALGPLPGGAGGQDRRFTDPAWADNPLLRRALQTYLTTSRTAEALISDARLGEQDRLRVEAAVSNVADALAPSNNPLLNPKALKAVVDTGGANFVRGARRLARDLSEPPRVPTMVEPDAFTVGETIAATPAPWWPAPSSSS